jgi:signal transduction histidine kinase/CheY-like chemotaxis protein
MVKKNSDITVTVIWYLFITAVIGIAFYTVMSFSKPYLKSGYMDEGQCIKWSDDWQYSDSSGDSRRVDMPTELSKPDVDTVYLTKQLPDTIRPGWYMAVYSSFQKVKVYIDGRLVDDYEGNESLLASPLPANEFRFISIGPADSGKVVRIEIETYLKNYKGSLNSVSLGDKSLIMYRALSGQRFTLISGMIIMMLGLILLVMRMTAAGKGRDGNVFVYIGTTMLLLGAWFAIQACVSQVIFDDLAASHFIELSTILMLPFPLYRYVDISEKRRFSKITDILCAVDLVAVIFTYVYCLVFRHDMMEILYITHVMIILSVIFTSATFCWTIFNDKKLFHELRWIEIAFLCLCIGAIVEVLQFYYKPAAETGVSLAISAIAYCSCTFIWAIGSGRTEIVRKDSAVRQARTKTLFLANMSHEIRTPINAILGMDALIIKESRQPQVVNYAKDLQESGRHLLTLINNILDFSRIESGKMMILAEKYDVADLISRTESFAEEYRKRDGVEFVMTNSSDIPASLVGDEEKIIQIVRNLLENSFNYTETGKVELIWNAEKSIGSAVFLEVTVRDTGNGISDEYMEHLFDPFHHVQKSEGAGLGLAIVRRLVELMRGSITVNSERGKGTVFMISVPQTAATDEVVGSSEIGAAPASRLYTAPKARILIADDEPMNLKVITGMLRDTRIFVDTVSSGEAVLDKICQGRYHVIFLDYLMPGMDGIETIRRMKKITEEEGNLNAETPVIMMSADDSTESREMFAGNGFDGYLGKPVALDEILIMIRKYLPDDIVREKSKGGH